MALPSLVILRRLIQSKVYCKFLTLSARKCLSHRPSKAASAKNVFTSVYVIGTFCFDKCFLFYVITGRHFLYKKFIVTQRLFATAMLLRSLKQVFWKKPVFYLRYLHNISACCQYQRFKIKYLLLKLKKVFTHHVFTFFHFVSVLFHIFLYK